MAGHIDNLRAALLALPATGPNGFEGLLAVVLSKIAGVPFRLAGSGYQRGFDGRAAFEADAVCFEGKRYDGDIHRSEVLTKIADLRINNKGEVDVWVLGASVPVKTQLDEDARADAADIGVSILLLDWSDTGLPPLAVALAMAEEPAATFIESNVSDKQVAARARAALQNIRADADFPAHSSRIQAQLVEPTIGVPLAKKANERWLSEAFSNRQKARICLGQPLCPGDAASGTLERPALVNRITDFLKGKPDSKAGIVLGGEGNGKSWLVGQAWLSLPEKPLMVFLTAEEFVSDSAPTNLIPLLIAKLIAQTDGRVGPAVENRWQRKLARWRNLPAPDAPRLVVIIDGLNQRPALDWARIIEGLADELEKIGGRLVVTSRSAFYAARIKRRLRAPVVEVDVPEWTEDERDRILATRNISRIELKPDVAASLRNPRLLSIALEQLRDAHIRELEELSVARLMFEHIRIHERDAPVLRPAHEFARSLAEHAKQIRQRITAQQRDDLRVFDALDSVSDERFFVPVAGDPTRYSISNEGLPLALGFAIIDELRRANDNKRDLAEAFEAMIEPLTALDETASIVFSALTIACLEEHCPSEVGVAVIGAFARLQNPNADTFPAFASLAVTRPEFFMEAARRICLSSRHEPNFDWIQGALHSAKEDEQAWTVMAPLLSSWLNTHTFSAVRRLHLNSARDPADKVAEEREKKEREIQTKLDSLSASERELLASLPRNDEGDLGALARLAMTLIASKPVAPFVPALRNWALSQAVNPEADSFNEFMHLVRLNRVDWQATRNAVLREGQHLERADTSTRGKWALVRLLHATGHFDDAAKARLLAEQLRNRQIPPFSSRLEGYCATDPCDPASVRPENIAPTAAKYGEIDATQLRLGRGSSALDYFFSEARAGVARFEPDVAIGKHRDLIADVATRTGLALRQGVVEIRAHSALITPELAIALARGNLHADAGEDASFVPQFRLAAAFPVLSASEQIELLLSPAIGYNVLLDLIESAKPLPEAEFESLFGDAASRSDELAQYKLLAVAEYTDTPVSPAIRAMLRNLVQSQSEQLRTQTLALIAKLKDKDLTEAVASSGWSAVNRSNSFELWHGSTVLVEAARSGIIPHQQAVGRLAPSYYGRAALRLDDAGKGEIARRLDASIRKAADLPVDFNGPDIELRNRRNDGNELIRFELHDQDPPSSDLHAGLRRASESFGEFAERQRALQSSFDAFREELTRQQANVVIENLRLEEFYALVACDPAQAESWRTLITLLASNRRSPVHNLGILLAHALAANSPDKASELFRLLRHGRPSVRLTYGRAGIALDQIALWAAVDSAELNALRFDRLDEAANDHELALEVLAALWNSKELLLRGYIEERLQTGQPSQIARGITAAGFAETSDFNSSVLERYKEAVGFLGSAYDAAIFAYERNKWSKHWYQTMCEAKSGKDFWCAAVLFSKTVDGRMDVWDGPTWEECAEPFQLFWPSVEKGLRARLSKWQSQREKKLFGGPAPAKVFLKQAGSD